MGYYGHGIISPVTEGVDFTLNYTLGLVDSNPSVAAFMIDNAFWGQVEEPKPQAPLPSGFSQAAVKSFRSYIQQRFGATSNIFFGTNATAITPPVAINRSASSPSPLFGVWKVWRSYAYAQAVERFRRTLHERNISLLANTLFWPLKWQSGCADELQHLDAVISESHFDAGWEMSLKLRLVYTLALGRPPLNYIAVFNQSCQSRYIGGLCPLRPASVVRGQIIGTLMQMSRPWLVAWGLSVLIDAPDTPANTATMEEVSRLMNFRSKYFSQLFDFGGSTNGMQAVRVGVLASFRHNNEAKCIRPPSSALQTLGVAFRFETEVSILKYGSLDGHVPLELLMCDGMATLSNATATKIASWVRLGGHLVATKSCGVVDELGRRYPVPPLQALLGGDEGGTGLGSAVFVDGTLETNRTIVSTMLDYKTVMAPRTPGHPKTTNWEISPWFAPSRPTQLVAHFSNETTETAGVTPPGDLVLNLRLPDTMLASVDGAVRVTATLLSPYENGGREVKVLQVNDSFVVVSVSQPPKYGVVSITAQDKDSI